MQKARSIFARCLAPVFAAVAMLTAIGGGGVAFAQYRADRVYDAPVMKNIPNPTITPRPNAQIPEDLAFTTSEGKSITLRELFHKKGATGEKPVILSLVYFSCPALCGMNQEALVNAIRQGPRSLRLGNDFDVVVVSIDPDDSTEIAATKRKNYLALADRPESQGGFTYVTGTEANIRQLADTVGFGYHRNTPDSNSADKFAHSLGIFVITPGAHMSQTIVNTDYTPDELHAALLQAADNKIGSGFLERIALPCGAMRLDPKTGLYKHNPWFYAGTAGGLASIAFTGVFLTIMWRGEWKKKHAVVPPADGLPPTAHLPT
jgi:protein SCO1